MVRRLARKGQSLPGCDERGTRHTQAESARFITDEQRAELRKLLLAGWPCSRAARFTVVGGSSAYRIRDELAAELARDGQPPLQPRFPGKSRDGLTVSPYWPPTGVKQIYAFRQLLATMSFDEAKAEWRQARRDEATRPKTFEEQLAAVRAGAKIAERQPIRKADPTYTLGGVATGAL